MVFASPQRGIHVFVQLVSGFFDENFFGLTVALIHEAVSAHQRAQQTCQTLRRFAHDTWSLALMYLRSPTYSPKLTRNPASFLNRVSAGPSGRLTITCAIPD
jgi:hypothetical protein